MKDVFFGCFGINKVDIFLTDVAEGLNTFTLFIYVNNDNYIFLLF